jgi:hypothetical protein
MTVAQSFARYREIDGRDSMSRASLWQGAASAYFGNNCAYNDAGLATATVTSKVKTTVAVAFTVGGKLFSKAITDNLWTLGVAGSNTTVPVGGFQKYALMLDDAGVATVQEATSNLVSLATVGWQNVTPLGGTNPVNRWAPIVSMLSASRAIIGILSIANATNPFIPGTTLLGAAGVTATYSGGIEPSLMPLIANETGLILGLNF